MTKKSKIVLQSNWKKTQVTHFDNTLFAIEAFSICFTMFLKNMSRYLFRKQVRKTRKIPTCKQNHLFQQRFQQ